MLEYVFFVSILLSQSMLGILSIFSIILDRSICFVLSLLFCIKLCKAQLEKTVFLDTEADTIQVDLCTT